MWFVAGRLGGVCRRVFNYVIKYVIIDQFNKYSYNNPMIKNLLLMLVAVAFVGYGLLASRQTSEGSWLYPVRILGDQIEYQLTPGDSDKVKLKLDWLGQKGIEVKKDNIANNKAAAENDTKDFNNLVSGITSDIKKLQDAGKDVTDLNQTLQAIIASCSVK